MNSIVIIFCVLSVVIYQATCIIVKDDYQSPPQLPIVHHEKTIDYYDHPKYSYRYGVEDLHTGDIKSASEQRNGDHVQGQYTLAEPDGTIRIVEYVADNHRGFNAIVKKIGHSIYPTEQFHHGHDGQREYYHGNY